MVNKSFFGPDTLAFSFPFPFSVPTSLSFSLSHSLSLFLSLSLSLSLFLSLSLLSLSRCLLFFSLFSLYLASCGSLPNSPLIYCWSFLDKISPVEEVKIKAAFALRLQNDLLWQAKFLVSQNIQLELWFIFRLCPPAYWFHKICNTLDTHFIFLHKD